MRRGLWLTRSLPFPLDSGDRVYSAKLIRSLAETGVQLTVAGFHAAPDPLPADWPVRWHVVPGWPHGNLRALFSGMPLVAAAHATAGYRRELKRLAAQAWDFVVFDQYGMGWALQPFLRQRTGGRGPVLVHVSHDHESSLYAGLVRDYQGPPLRRAVLWQNAWKTARLEGRLARSVDLVTAITEEDAARFYQDAPATDNTVLTPGYDGLMQDRRELDAGVPRKVLMVGSFHWIAKSENLRRFVAMADPAFARAGIELHIVGSMPRALAEELGRTTRATVLHGFVDDIGPHLSGARIGVVPEAIGGGFKLKFLDYVFGRLPVATLEGAAAGLPLALKSSMLRAPDMEALVGRIVAAIDDVPLLQRMQEDAFATALPLFRWSDRGQRLLHAVDAAGGRRSQGLAPVPHEGAVNS